jgi:putative transposase
MLGKKIEAYEKGEQLSFRDLQNEWKFLKRAEETKWLAEVDSQSFYQTKINLESAYKSFFKQKKGFPKFKKKKNRNTFTCPNSKRELNWENNTLTVPKIKNIKIVVTHPPILGKVKKVTFELTPSGKYFASILFEIEGEYPKPKTPEKVVGIDVGLIDIVALSNGSKVANPKTLKKHLQKLKFMQRRHSKKQKGSANREKSRIKLARQHEKVANTRKDFLHKLSTRIVRDNQFDSIAVESLNITGMVKNHKLAGAISDAAWGMFFTMLQYKCLWQGKNFVKLDPFERSTHECSSCGSVPEKMGLSERSWVCASCNIEHDRDTNAAIVIANKGLTKLREAISQRACGDTDISRVAESGSPVILRDRCECSLVRILPPAL